MKPCPFCGGYEQRLASIREMQDLTEDLCLSIMDNLSRRGLYRLADEVSAVVSKIRDTKDMLQ